jgi:hypothetical protein
MGDAEEKNAEVNLARSVGDIAFIWLHSTHGSTGHNRSRQ